MSEQVIETITVRSERIEKANKIFNDLLEKASRVSPQDLDKPETKGFFKRALKEYKKLAEPGNAVMHKVIAQNVFKMYNQAVVNILNNDPIDNGLQVSIPENYLTTLQELIVQNCKAAVGGAKNDYKLLHGLIQSPHTWPDEVKQFIIKEQQQFDLLNAIKKCAGTLMKSPEHEEITKSIQDKNLKGQFKFIFANGELQICKNGPEGQNLVGEINQTDSKRLKKLSKSLNERSIKDLTTSTLYLIMGSLAALTMISLMTGGIGGLVIGAIVGATGKGMAVGAVVAGAVFAPMVGVAAYRSHTWTQNIREEAAKQKLSGKQAGDY